MTPHIDAEKGEIAETILLPGDPLRAEWLATTYLADVTCYNRVRGMLGFTGTWHGHRISVQGTGMGQPSLAIYVNELLDTYGVKTLVRVGTCGGISPTVGPGDLILAMTASTDSSMNRRQFDAMDYAPCADWSLLKKAAGLAEGLDAPLHVGGIFSGDRFYTGEGDYYRALRDHGVLAAEMEASTLYTLAARRDARALAILTVTDMIGGGEEMSPEERQTGLSTMAELALATVAA